MTLYRYRIIPLSAFATPLRSDTLYGHLLWAAAMRHGRQRVTELIDGFAGDEPPFVLSSALPAGQLPVPPLPGIPRAKFKQQHAGQGELLAALKAYKAFRKQPTWSLDVWTRRQGRVGQEALFDAWQENASRATITTAVEHDEPHVTIDRTTGSVLGSGGLFFSRTTWYRPGTTLDLYVRTGRPELFEELFADLAATGYGADRSTGKGHFRFERDMGFDPTPFEAPGTHRLCLSVCAAADTRDFAGYWTPFVKHGRAWSGFGQKNPFKKPCLAFAEGSLFSRMPRKGYLLRNIHSDPDLVQVGWPLTIPMTLEGHHAD